MMFPSRRRINSLLAVVGLACAWGSAVSAQTTHNVPADFATIQEAIEASEFGDTILVGPGTYQESILLTEQKGNGLIIKSTDGRARTTISYSDEDNANEAVITIQRCTNSTQLIGFSIDGRGLARRGILTNSSARPVLKDLLVYGCEYGVAAHRSSRPYIRNLSTRNSRTAGLFISGGSADVLGGRFASGEKFGVYIGSASEEVRLRDVFIYDNDQVGLQASDSELSFVNGEVRNNGDTGIILNESSPTLRNLTISGHPNIGVVMEISSAVLVNCDIRDNEFGAVSSIEGSPTIIGCVFANNAGYHVGIEGDAQPTIGGSVENANLFLGSPDFRVQHTSTMNVIATHNYWDLPCAPKEKFQIEGQGKLRRSPWVSGNLLREFRDCREARKYNKQFWNGRLDEEGSPIPADVWQAMKKKVKRARATAILAKERGDAMDEDLLGEDPGGVTSES